MSLICLRRACRSFTILSCLLITGAAFGQGSQADYERSASYLEWTRNKVFRSRIQPHWFADGSRFWYRVQTAPRQYEFVTVDAKTGTRKLALTTTAWPKL